MSLRSRIAGHAVQNRQPGAWGPPGAWPGNAWSAPLPWPTPLPWPVGEVPWGFSQPPELPPVLEPPGSFHPPVSRRPKFSLRDRRSPRLYALGLALGLPAITALLLVLVGAAAGFKPTLGAVPPLLTVEAVSIAAAVGTIGWAVAQGRQRRADGWRDYSGPSPFLTVGAFLAATTAGTIPVELILKAVNVDVQSPPATLCLLLVYLATYFGLVHFLAVRTGALTWHDIAAPAHLAPSSDDWGSSTPRPTWTRAWGLEVESIKSRISGGRLGDVLVGLALVLPLLFASNLMSSAMLLVLGLQVSDIVQSEVLARDAISILITFITVAIVAPIGEEVFFRGFATNAWARSLSHNSAILRSSLFFAFIHVMNTATTDAAVSWRVAIFNFGARLPVAIALTWIYMRRRSILASGMLHAGYNGLITLISFL